MNEREITSELLAFAGEFMVVTIPGPRQTGKTTLAQMTFTDKPFEIKSAATFNPQFIKGIERFREVAGDRCRAGQILYNGENG